jgi:acyl-[acyl-carrier-protein]-phospholipid O-acyltransferase/long-chain-fatty-acid--[acyl-carrier-protein] ligase
VENNQLNSANAYIEAGTFFAILFGTILGGWSAAQNEWVILALLITISCLGLFSSYRMNPVPVGAPDLKMDKSWLNANKKLLSVLNSVPGSMQKIIGLSWFWGLGAAALSILPPYAKDIVMADENVVTLFLATFTIGIAIGAGIVPLLLRWRSADHVVRIGGLLMSIALIDWAFLKLGAVPFLKMQVDIFGDISKFSVTTLQNTNAGRWRGAVHRSANDGSSTHDPRK